MWLRQQEPYAYALLGLRPWELGRYTVNEYQAAIDGAIELRHQAHEFDASMTGAVVTTQLGKRGRTFRADQLLSQAAKTHALERRERLRKRGAEPEG